MKLREILPESGIPSRIPDPTASAAAFSAPAETVAAGMNHLAGLGLRGLNAIQAAEDAIKVVRIRSEARTLESGVGDQLDKLRNDLALSHADDPDGYLQLYKNGAQQIERETMAAVRIPETKTILGPRLQRAFGADLVKAQNQQKVFIHSKLGADLDTTVDNYRREAGRAPLADDAAFADSYRKAQEAVNDSQIWQGPKAAADLGMKVRDRFFDDRATRAANEDPQGFQDEVLTSNRWQNLSPKRTTELVQHAQAVQRQRTAQEDHDQVRLQREIDRQTTATIGRLQDQILGANAGAPRPTEAELRADPGWKFIVDHKPEAVEHLLKMVREPAVGPSDPATHTYVIQNLGDRPTISEAKIKEFNATKGPNGLSLLNDHDTVAALNQVRERTQYWRDLGRADQHRNEDKALADTHRRYNEVLSTGITALSLTGSLAEKLDPKQQELQAIWKRALLEQAQGAGEPTQGFPRNRPPEELLETTLPGLMQRLDDAVGQDKDKAKRQLEIAGYRSFEDLQRKWPGDAKKYADNPAFREAVKLYQRYQEAQEFELRRKADQALKAAKKARGEK